MPVWDFKPAWKQVLLTWRFISAAFQNDLIFWWTCVGKFHFCQNDRNEFQTHMLIKSNIQRAYAYSFRFACSLRLSILFTGKSHANLKFHSGLNDGYEIHTGLSFISSQFMCTRVKSWLNTEKKFSIEVKSHTGLNSFCLSCERTLKCIINITESTFLLYLELTLCRN